jgi:pyruvate formate lyase activating enzyme
MSATPVEIGPATSGHGTHRAVTGYVAYTISFSSVYGPGNRFVVFMQGCNFYCVACHNPQTIPGH